VAHTAELRNLRSRAAAASRWGKPDAEDLSREFRAAKLREHIRQVVDSAPPLSDDQRRELAALLAPTGGAA
jgi:hypothetical protein